MIAHPPASNPAHPHAPPQAPLRPGGNVRLGRNSLGFWIEGPSGGAADFRHPWLVTAGGRGAQVSRGLILASQGAVVEPLIGAVPLSGSADGRQKPPVLPIDPGLANSAGESWICVEVTPDADGNLDAAGKRSKVEVVQRTTPSVMLGKTGRVPLAQLVFFPGQAIPQVVQIAFFYFRYLTSQSATGQRKHFFL